MEQKLTFNWYILAVRGGREEKVKQELENSKWKVQVKDFKVVTNQITQKNLLKGYVLCYCHLTTELVKFFYNLPGRIVIDFMGHSRKELKESKLPEPLSQKAVDSFLNEVKARKEEIVLPEVNDKIELKEGDVVKIKEGSFKGLEGEITRLSKDHQKIDIILTSLGWEITGLPVSHCQKVAS